MHSQVWGCGSTDTSAHTYPPSYDHKTWQLCQLLPGVNGHLVVQALRSILGPQIGAWADKVDTETQANHC